MSLDVYLEAAAPAVAPGPPVILIRENGATREISLDEWNERFPGQRGLRTIERSAYETPCRARIAAGTPSPAPVTQKSRMAKLWNELDTVPDMARRERRSCHYCGAGMTKRGTKEPRSATVDHVIPKSRGGNGSPINTVICCRLCNNEKGNFTGVEYRAWIKAGRPSREVFKSNLPHFKLRYAAEDGTHFEWFKRLYIDNARDIA